MALMAFLMKLSVVLLCDRASYLWQQLDWGRKWLVGFNEGKSQLVSFDQSNNTGAIDVKMDGFVLEEKSSFKIPRLSFSCRLDWALTLSLLLKLPARKMAYFGRCLSELAQRVPLPHSRGRSACYLINSIISLSLFLDVTRMPMSTVSLVVQLDYGILSL